MSVVQRRAGLERRIHKGSGGYLQAPQQEDRRRRVVGRGLFQPPYDRRVHACVRGTQFPQILELVEAEPAT